MSQSVSEYIALEWAAVADDAVRARDRAESDRDKLQSRVDGYVQLDAVITAERDSLRQQLEAARDHERTLSKLLEDNAQVYDATKRAHAADRDLLVATERELLSTRTALDAARRVHAQVEEVKDPGRLLHELITEQDAEILRGLRDNAKVHLAAIGHVGCGIPQQLEATIALMERLIAYHQEDKDNK